ncbi:MAG: hypothetical protein IJU29_02720 [Oscillospiraceae bacterium]|nr:hypothetical protein [Oscillospiraceae bacterium]
MTDKGQTTFLISKYMDALRVQQADGKEKELEKQLCEMRAQLQALGVVVEELKIR